MVAALGRVGAKAHHHRVAHRRRSTMPSSRCRSRPRCFRSAMSAASAAICPTAWCRSTTCSRRAAATRCRRSSAAGNPAAHVAVVTWDVAADGLVPVARNHAELIAGGLAALLEGGIAQDAAILSAIPLGSFAGLALDRDAVAARRRHAGAASCLRCRTFRRAMPRRTTATPSCCRARRWRALAEAGLLGADDCRTCSRSGARRSGSPAARRWQRRGRAGRRAGLRRDRPARGAPRRRRQAGADSAAASSRAARRSRRGHGGRDRAHRRRHARAARPDGAARTPSRPAPSAASAASQGGRGRLRRYRLSLPARPRQPARSTVTGPPAGIVSVGGYRFGSATSRRWWRTPIGDATIAALPDALLGHRLAGSAPDRAATCARHLQARGVNPLIADAFRDRAAGDAA